jgi:multimeric flavodoxin WrbA
MKILAIVGSPRINGNTNYLVDTALDEVKKLGFETEKIILSQHRILPCLGHDDCTEYDACTQKDDMAAILNKFCDADAVILATPVYFYNVTAQMKAFIDRNFFIYNKNRRVKARAVGYMIITEMSGIQETEQALHNFVDWSLRVPRDRRFVMTGYAGKMGDARGNSELEQNARKLGRQLISALKK